MPGIRLSTTNRSNGALGEVPLRLARARRLDDLVPLVAQRAAQPLEDLLFVVGEQDRAADRAHARASGGAAAGRCGSRCPRRGWLVTAMRAAEAFDDVLGDRQAEAGAGAPRREVRVEDVRHVLGRDADAAIADGDRDAAAVVPRRDAAPRLARHGDRRPRRRVPPARASARPAPRAGRWSGCSRAPCAAARRR